MTIHWCGTGLSSIPGLRRLLEAGHPFTVWNRTVEKARADLEAQGFGLFEVAPEVVVREARAFLS